MRSWERMLEALRVSLAPLIMLRNLSDGVVSSNVTILAPLCELPHLVFHLFLAVLLWCCLSATGLATSLLRSRGGRSFLSEVVPLAAIFASLSALSLPAIPTCPAVQRIKSEYLFERLCL